MTLIPPNRQHPVPFCADKRESNVQGVVIGGKYIYISIGQKIKKLSIHGVVIGGKYKKILV